MPTGRPSATTMFGDFEWDPVKEARNIRDRDLDFATASEIWHGGVIEKIDNRRDYGEIRILARQSQRTTDGGLIYLARHPTPNHIGEKGQPT